MNRKTTTIIILLATAIVFLCLNLFVPYYDDDIWYALKYIPNEILAPITQFSDILTAQYHHYMGENSRALVHIVLQTLLATLPDRGFDILNTIVFLLLVWLATRYTQPAGRKTEPLPLLLTIVGIYGLLPDMAYLFYWASGSLNYMWTSVATLAFLLYWQKSVQTTTPIRGKTWLYALMALCCGSLHEAFALPIGGAILLYMLTHYRHIGPNATTLIAAAYGLGCITILLAPGLENKAANIGYTSIQEFISLAVTSLRSLRVIPLGIVIFLTTLCRKSWRERGWQFVRENSFILSITIISLLFILSIRAGSTGRIYYATEFFALLCLLRYLNVLLQGMQEEIPKYISIGISALLIAWVAVVLPECYHTGKQHYTLVEAYQTDSDGIIFLPQEDTHPIAQQWVINLHQTYWLAPEAEWRSFVTPLAQLNDTLTISSPVIQRDARHNYRLYNRYIQMIPGELQVAIENPSEFFTAENKISGDNPFYGITDGDYIIARRDSIPAHEKWNWHYYPASAKEPSASLSGFLRRVFAPHTFPVSEPILWLYSVTLPNNEAYIIAQRPQYRTLKSIEVAP